MATRDPSSTSSPTPGEMPAGARAEQAARNAAESAKETLGQAKDKAQDQVKSQVGGQLTQAGEGVSSVAEAVTQLGDQLRQKDQRQLAAYTDRAAGQMQRLAGYLRDAELDDLLYDARQLAQRQPMLFMGSAFALGLVASRFLKASSPRREDEYPRFSGSAAGRRESYAQRNRYQLPPGGQGVAGQRPMGQPTAGASMRPGAGNAPRSMPSSGMPSDSNLPPRGPTPSGTPPPSTPASQPAGWPTPSGGSGTAPSSGSVPVRSGNERGGADIGVNTGGANPTPRSSPPPAPPTSPASGPTPTPRPGTTPRPSGGESPGSSGER